jgi:predicted permease
MPLMSKLFGLFRNLVHRDRVEHDLDTELRGTYEMLVAEKIQAGATSDAARRTARLELGGVEQLKERIRDVRMGTLVDSVLKDARYAGRSLARNPGFAAVTIVTLALGIGANTAIFSAVRAVLLRALPYQDPDRVVMVWEDASLVGFPQNTPAPANYLDWKRLNHVFIDVAATRYQVGNLTADGPPEQLLGRGVTANFFSVLGVQPALGRAFTEDEERTGASVVVISHRLWHGRYDGDPAVIGKTILLNGSKQAVIGVMPPGFVFRNRDIDFWTGMSLSPAEVVNRGSHYLNVVARLRSDVTLQQARDDMNAVARQLAIAYPETNRQGSAVVIPIDEDVLGDTRLELLVLTGAAGCVLLIACANLASLLLSRAVKRSSELAMRVALGATRGRLIQQMVVEAMLLALMGGALGLALAPAAMTVLARLIPTSLPDTTSTVLDVPLLLFTAVVSLATGLLFGLAPALLAARGSIHHTMQQAGRAEVGGKNRMTRDVLVLMQVAIAFVLLVGAGLMLRTMANLHAIAIGFRSAHLLTMRTTLPRARYSDPTRRLAFYDRVLSEVRSLPGIQGGAYASTLPFVERGNTNDYLIEGQPRQPGQDALFRVGTNDYLATLGVHLVEGRLPNDGDAADAPKVVVLNETLARRHWPGASALGHRVSFNGPDGPWRTVVGVVADIRERGYLPDMKPGVYVPYSQILDTWALPEYLLVRTTGDPVASAGAIRKIVARADSEQPVTALRTMEDIIDLDIADRRQQLTLLGAFAGLALVLATLGLYGLLSYGVAQRRREIGLRIALGASRRSVVGLVMTHGLALTVVGLAIGLTMATALTQTLNALLYGIGATDPSTFGGVVILLVVVSLGACTVPALRAAHMDPMQVLREE